MRDIEALPIRERAIKDCIAHLKTRMVYWTEKVNSGGLDTEGGYALTAETILGGAIMDLELMLEDEQDAAKAVA